MAAAGTAVTLFTALLLLLPNPAPQARKAEVIAKADGLFGQRYVPPADKPLRLYDERKETGPPDVVMYQHSSAYVTQLVFAMDGSLARVELFPAALLHTDNWNDVPQLAQLSPSEMASLIETAKDLRPVGKPRSIAEPPNGCFQSGRNLYCSDLYEFAVVSHYHIEEVDSTVLRQMAIAYRQEVSGVVEDMRIEDEERQLRIRGRWYQTGTLDADRFSTPQVGSSVRLVTYGCAGNEKVCLSSFGTPKGKN